MGEGRGGEGRGVGEGREGFERKEEMWNGSKSEERGRN